MSNVRLSPTSYVVLGMIALRGRSTSYDLKRAIGHSVGYFWPFPHAQLYDEPERLAEAGLLEKDQEANGRRRRTYGITDDGREALRGWLRQPVDEILQIRDVAQLKLFFSELGTTDDIVALAQEQERLHQKRLAEYESISDRFSGVPELTQRMATLEFGLRLERVVVGFWNDIAKNPPVARPRERRGRRSRTGRS